MEQLQATGVALPWETETICKNGSRVPVLVGVAMLDYPKTIAFITDLTDRLQLDDVIAPASEELCKTLRKV